MAKFQKGHPGYKPKGSGNRLARDLKHGIVEAAVKHGSDGKGRDGLQGFFQYMIKTDLKAFASLMGRVIPLQISGSINNTVAAVYITPVPSGQYLTEAQIRALMPDHEAAMIDIRPNTDMVGDDVTDQEDVA